MGKISDNECGYRVKHARLLAGLSRRVLEEIYGISGSTVQAWEIGRNPLTAKGAKRLSEAFQQTGLFCTAEWLLTGEGLSPRPHDEIVSSLKKNQVQQTSDVLFEDEEAISKEIIFFQEINTNSIVLNIIDDAMEPVYFIGDYVGGKMRTDINPLKIVGLNCIIQTTDDEYYIRKISSYTIDNKFTLASINPNTTVHFPVLYNQSVKNVAPIIWHRRKNID